MNAHKKLNTVRARRQVRSRAKIFGTLKRPRLAIFKSNTSIYAQLINDDLGHTLVSASNREMKADKKATKSEVSKQVGVLLAEKAKKGGIMAAVFDRRGHKYHGRIKALAEGAREGGLKI